MFVLDGTPVATSLYATRGRPDSRPVPDVDAPALARFAESVFVRTTGSLPSAVVVDVGTVLVPGAAAPTWTVIEANAAWSSGVYACDPDAALQAVLRSAGPRDEVRQSDVPFLRCGAGRGDPAGVPDN